MTTQELIAWLRLTLEPGVGSVTARQLLSVFGLPQQIFAASYMQLSGYVSSKIARQLAGSIDPSLLPLIKQTLDWLALPEHGILTLADAAYPRALLDTYDPPVLLYYDGQLAALQKPMLAVVGSRSATLAGIANAKNFSRYLAQQGWCIVSGLAHGIDAAAHAGALSAMPDVDAADAQGSRVYTIGVLATGINRMYPADNRDLAYEIKKKGLLLSEFPLNTPAVVHQFPKRNRIVAALSQGVLVVEAAKQSGSLITARQAGELGREVFAIPGSIHSPMAHGCHALIRQGAKLVETAQDIIEELTNSHGRSKVADVKRQKSIWANTQDKVASCQDKSKPPQLLNSSQPTKSSQISNTQMQPEVGLLSQMGFDAWSIDDLANALKQDVATLMVQLLNLELNNDIQKLPDGRYQRL